MNKLSIICGFTTGLLMSCPVWGYTIPNAEDVSNEEISNMYVRASLPDSSIALRFGVIPDTQGSDNGVPVVQSEAVGARLVEEAPSFVIHVGDLTDGNYEGSAKLTELKYLNKIMVTPLLDAGINFYPIPGNHDAKVYTTVTNDDGDTVPVWQAAYPYLFTDDASDGVMISSDDVPGGSESSTNSNNYSYVIDAGDNTYLVALDMWNGGTDNNNYSDWVVGKFEELRAAHPSAHIFAYSHSGLYSVSKHAAMTEYISAPDAFIAGAHEYGVDGWFSGHNHIYDRSVGLDADNADEVGFFNITSGSASTKDYNLSRSPADDQRVNCIIDSTVIDGAPIAYQLVTVNGSFVTIKNWMAPASTDAKGNTIYPDWTVCDEYTYSTNGRRFVLAPLADYDDAQISDSSPSGNDFIGTSITITNGVSSDETTYSFTASSGGPGGGTPPGLVAALDASADTTIFDRYRVISIGWLTPYEWYYEDERNIISDVVSIHGMTEAIGENHCDSYTLSISYNDSGMSAADEEALTLVAFLDRDTSDADQGDWTDAFLATSDVSNVYAKMRAPADDDAVGTWGIDVENNVVWARLDYQGDFAISYDAKLSSYWPAYESGAKWDDVMGWIDDSYFPWVYCYTYNNWYYVYAGVEADMNGGYWIAYYTSDFSDYGWGYIYTAKGWWAIGSNMSSTWLEPGAALPGAL